MARHRQKIAAPLTGKVGKVSVRMALAFVAGLAIAILSTGHSLAQIGNRTVFTALGPIGQNPSGSLRSVTNQLVLRRELGDPRTVQTAVRQAFAIAPLNAVAVRSAALVAELERKPDMALRGMILANRLSRRDGVAQTWLINSSLRRGDVTDVLEFYDVVLRTLPAGARPLLGNLARTLVVPQMRSAFAPYIKDDNPWFHDFAEVAVQRQDHAYAFAQMLATGPRLPDTVPLRGHYSTAARSVADKGDFRLLASLYRKLPGARMDDVRSLALPREDVGANYLPIAWLLRSDSSYGAWPAGSPAKPELELAADGGSGGTVASKLLLLDPGTYRIDWSVIDAELAMGAEAQIVATCIGTNGRSQLAIAPLLAGGVRFDRSPDNDVASLAGQHASAMRFTTGPGCGAVMIDIVARGGQEGAESRWQIDRLNIVRVGAASQVAGDASTPNAQ